jgi:hypothetical protein
MKKNAVLLIAAVAGFYLYTQGNKARANGGMARVGTTSASPVATKNLNADMWSRLLGNGWRSLLQGNAANGVDTPPFVMRNPFGQIVTSDGTPVYSGDTADVYNQSQLGLPPLTDVLDFGATQVSGDTELAKLDPLYGFRNPTDYFNGNN